MLRLIEINEEVDYISERFDILDENNPIESQEIERLHMRLDFLEAEVEKHIKLKNKSTHLRIVT